MTPTKPRPFLVALATAVASQDGVVAAGDSVRNLPTRLGAEQRLLPGVGHPVSGHLSVVEDLPAERVPIHQAWRGEGKPQGLPTKRSPPGLLLRIVSHLDLEDIARLSQTSQRFSKLCKSEALWERIVRAACDHVSPDLRALAAQVGWRQTFFTNKLQLQRQLRRRRQRQGGHRKGAP
ncbi:F-box only protein 36 isoform X2 [Sorex araneus]|uniref:F-box only protein 36 isoform X2 n=1 Tax=Sorex araneus TaxID=42254 RepID=UPI002433F335|nr:F-box only protein 36 isoform X2 [Sorex araneus]